MKLVFRINIDDNLEKTSAASRYRKFWEENNEEILSSLYKHTGLHFKQHTITVRIRADERSRAGNSHSPMELSMTYKEQDSIACALIHELAHRLVIGNGIEPPEDNAFIKSHANYYMHKHIDLFLYDVFLDVLSKEAADYEVKRESVSPESFYAKAWKWALDMDYAERQVVFDRLKKRYIK